MELPEYNSHKTVRAGKITNFDLNTQGDHELTLEGDGWVTKVIVSDEYMHKHTPSVGGYYVQYEDGYESWSPAKAFEAGYKKVE